MPRGRRKTYSPEQQHKIIGFILARGRGGMAAAHRKFKVSYPTMQKWIHGGRIVKVDGRRRKSNPELLQAARQGLALLKRMSRSIREVDKLIRGLAK